MVKTPIRAKIPKEFNVNEYCVLEFKRINYNHSYILRDNYYRYSGISAESAIRYTEGAMLSWSEIEVFKFFLRNNYHQINGISVDYLVLNI